MQGISYPKLAPDTLVEFKQGFTFDQGALSVFETYQEAHKVSLQFDSPVVTGMIAGRKIMHLEGRKSFDFLPGETVVMAAGGTMTIDFPDAELTAPTKCLAIEIETSLISQSVDLMQEKFARSNDEQQWSWDEKLSHLNHNQAVADTVLRLLTLWQQAQPAADLLSRIAMQELVIRLLQTEARIHLLTKPEAHLHHNRLAMVIKSVKQAPHKNWEVAQMADLACMSVSHFAHRFKQEIGISPLQFVLQIKLDTAAKRILHDREQVGKVAFELGFGQANYFIKQFKRQYGLTPEAWRRNQLTLIQQH